MDDNITRRPKSLQTAVTMFCAMNLNRRVYIFRHGETDWNLNRRIQGHTDIPLNARGSAQAEELAQRLQRCPIEVILSSDLARARQTAEVVAAQLAVPVYFDPRLREASLGEAEGLTVEEVVARFGGSAWDKWRSTDPADWEFHFPGGEPKRSTLERSSKALEDFLGQHPFGTVAVSTHGGVIRTLVGSCVTGGSDAISIQNCAVHVMDRHAHEWKYVGLDEADGDSPEF